MQSPEIEFRKAAFTLVELLTAILALLVLVGILIAALGSVRRSADLADGLSAMRNVGNAMHLKIVDNRGILPWSGQDTQYAIRRRQDDHDQLLHQLIPYLGHSLEDLEVNQVIPGSVGRAYLRERDPLRYPPYKSNASVMLTNGEVTRPFGRRGTGSGGDTDSQASINIEEPSRQVALTDVDIFLRTEGGGLSEPNRDEPVYKRRLALYFDWRVEALPHDHNYYFRKMW